MKSLITNLNAWDGKHIDHLETVYSENAADLKFFEDLVSICLNNHELQTASTWLIKHHYDNKKALSDILMNQLLEATSTMTHWEAKLHVLQLLPKINITENNFIIIEDFVRVCLVDEVKFVRAWAFQGFYELTKLQPSYTYELKLLCEKAMLTESASITSKVRKILAKL